MLRCKLVTSVLAVATVAACASDRPAPVAPAPAPCPTPGVSRAASVQSAPTVAPDARSPEHAGQPESSPAATPERAPCPPAETRSVGCTPGRPLASLVPAYAMGDSTRETSRFDRDKAGGARL